MKYKLQNTGELIHNDVVLPSDTFKLIDNKYNFKILPRTQFWRFGIRLSKTPDIAFFHPDHRYKTPEFDNYIDIHIGVGEWNNVDWSLPNRLHLAQYNIPEYDHLFSRQDNYREYTDVLWMIQMDEKSGTFTSLLISKDNEVDLKVIEIDPEFKYFKVFAWADKIEFKLELDLSVSTEEVISKNTSTLFHLPSLPLSSYERKYLDILYEALLENKVIENPLQIEQIWNEQQFPKEFTYESIHPLLASGTEIKIWGIWHVDPSSTLFDSINRVIQTIKWLLKNTQTRLLQVTSNMILAYCPEITLIEVNIVFRLLHHLPDFSCGYGYTRNLIYHIQINDPKVYQRYLKITDFQSYMLDYLKSYSIIDQQATNKTLTSSDLNKDIQSSSPIFVKTQIPSIARSQLTPVLGVNEIAADFAEIMLTLPEDKGQMLGIFGKWGRGKSFLIEEIWRKLKENTQLQFIRVDYHAWKYQETPASWAYLYEVLVKEFEGNKKGIKNYLLFWWRRLKLNYERVGLLPMLVPVFALSTTIVSWILSFTRLDLLFTVFIIPTTVLVFIKINKDLEERYSFNTSELIKKYLSRFSFKDKLGIQAEIQEELIKLFKVWLPKDIYKTKKILLIVEDLDRCTEDKIIQNIDSLRIMLDDTEISNRLIILTAIDERILKNAIRSKYKTFIRDETTGKNNEDALLYSKTNELVSEYLDKIFISAIKLGSLNNEQTEEFFRELIKNQVTEDVNISQVKNETFVSSSAVMENSPFVQKNQHSNISEQSDNLQSIAQSQPFASFEKLTIQEVDYLENALKSWPSITPRKIYIFYYRYLLCKNLLIKKYEKENIKNGWQDIQSIKTLLSLLIHFSKSCDPNSIADEKERVAAVDTSDVVIKKITETEQELKKGKIDYLFLLEIFELVIAY